MSVFKPFNDLAFRTNGSIKTIGEYLAAAEEVANSEPQTEEVNEVKKEIIRKAVKLAGLIKIGTPLSADVVRAAKILGFEV